MRASVATLADSTNVREGFLSMLSAGISVLSRESFPADLGAELALQLELDQHDLSEGRTIDLRLRVLDSEGEPVWSIRGRLSWTATEDWPQCVPAPVDLRGVQLPSAGRYQIELKVGTLDEILIPFSAEQSPESGDPPIEDTTT